MTVLNCLTKMWSQFMRNLTASEVNIIVECEDLNNQGFCRHHMVKGIFPQKASMQRITGKQDLENEVTV